MIKEITIQNFHSHKNTTLFFKEGLNVITGSSDSGKSSIIRSLMWVVNNRPAGDSIKNWDCKKDDEVSVTIELSGGCVTKERINGKNKYLLDVNEGSYEFEAFKSDVPQEVLDLFNFSEFNIQTQHQPYFLLNDSPGEVAKKLNDLVGLSVIDKAFKNLNSTLLESKRNIASMEIEQDRLESEVEKLSHIDGILEKVIALEDKNKLFKSIEDRYNSIFDCLESLDSIDNEVKTFASQIKDISRIEKVLVLISEFNAKNQVAFAMDSLIEDCLEIDSEILNKTKNLKEKEEEYKEILKKYGICPTCGQTITYEIMERINK